MATSSSGRRFSFYHCSVCYEISAGSTSSACTIPIRIITYRKYKSTTSPIIDHVWSNSKKPYVRSDKSNGCASNEVMHSHKVTKEQPALQEHTTPLLAEDATAKSSIILRRMYRHMAREKCIALVSKRIDSIIPDRMCYVTTMTADDGSTTDGSSHHQGSPFVLDTLHVSTGDLRGT